MVSGAELPVLRVAVLLDSDVEFVGRLTTPPGTAGDRGAAAPVLTELPDDGMRLGVRGDPLLDDVDAGADEVVVPLDVLPDDEDPDDPDEEPDELPAVVLGIACPKEATGTASAHATPSETRN